MGLCHSHIPLSRISTMQQDPAATLSDAVLAVRKTSVTLAKLKTVDSQQMPTADETTSFGEV